MDEICVLSSNAVSHLLIVDSPDGSSQLHCFLCLQINPVKRRGRLGRVGHMILLAKVDGTSSMVWMKSRRRQMIQTKIVGLTEVVERCQ